MLIPARDLMPILRAALQRGQRVRLAVNGRSMWPCIRDGDVVELAPMPPRPALGMVVLAQLADERYALHRLVRHSGVDWILRGDSNREPDGLVSAHNLLGVVTRVERHGRAACFAPGRAGQGIAWLSARGWLVPCTRAAVVPRRVARAVLRRLQRLARFRAWAKRFRPNYVIQSANASDLVTLHAWIDLTGEGQVDWVEQNTTPDVSAYVAQKGTELLGSVRLVRNFESDTAPPGYWLYSLQVRSCIAHKEVRDLTLY
jgi:hypothetical protein